MAKTKTATKRKLKRTYFNTNWLNQYDWIAEVKDDRTKFRCNVCNKNYTLSNMGVAALLKHIGGKFYFIRNLNNRTLRLKHLLSGQKHKTNMDSKRNVESKGSSIRNKRKLHGSDSPIVNQPKRKRRRLNQSLPPHALPVSYVF